MIEEPILKKKKTNKNRYIFFSILTLFLFVGVSYGLIFFVQEYQGSSLGLKTEILSVDISSNGVVALDDALPQKDADGLNNDKTTFSITNNSNTAVKVVISLEEDATSTMDSNNIRFAVFNDYFEIINLGNLGENDNILYEFNLGEGQEIYIDSTIWIDYYYSGSGETFSAKYKVEASNIDEYGTMYLKNLVNKNKGLYGVNEDGTLNDGTTEPYEYRYSGLNPDNYINFNNETWRIIGIVEGNIKIVREEVLEATSFGEDNIYDESNAFNTLNTYYETFDSVYQDMVYEGILNASNVTLSESFNEEWLGGGFFGKIGLLNVDDFVFSSSPEYYTSAINNSNISSTTWLTGTYLTMAQIVDTDNQIVAINNNIPTSVLVTDTSYGLKPCLYLRKDVSIISGNGTIDSPYEVMIVNEEIFPEDINPAG